MIASVKKNFPDKFLHDRLYHYTTEAVLDIFLKDDACLYCTSTEDLNDEVEFKIGLELGLEYLGRLLVNNPCTYESICATINEMVEQKLWHGWVMSFTSKPDDLSQWRAYTDGKKGGYAIGFDYWSLTELIATQNARWKCIDITGSNQPYILYLFPCFYQVHDDIDLLLKLLFESFAPVYANTVHDENNAPMQLRLIGTMLSMLLLFASVYKQESFHDECETRLVMLNQFQVGRPGIMSELIYDKHRIKVPMFPDILKVRDLIKSVCRSPHGDRPALEKHLRDACDKYGRSFICEASKSTYRVL